MPQPKNLDTVIRRFSEMKHYVVINRKTNAKVLILADIQQIDPLTTARQVGNIDTQAKISILVPHDGKQPILQAGNTHVIFFQGVQYAIVTVLDSRRTRFMKYIAVAQFNG